MQLSSPTSVLNGGRVLVAHLAVALGMFCFGSSSAASEIDDCLLTNLKGISSDVAARMVRDACERKVAERRRADLVERFGEAVYKPISVISSEFVVEDSSTNSGVRAVIQNDLRLTAMVIRLNVWDDFGRLMGKPCGTNSLGDVKSYLFKVNVKPGGRATLIGPTDRILSDAKLICSAAEVVRGRDYRSTDSAQGTYTLISHEEAEAMSKALGEKVWPTSSWRRPKQ